ncbi:hypothetical protein ACGFZB_11545 [Streptomyces cinerochromogenes]|uniref:Uncharacterized protein n=1 Tax=Streptomyces cinerochromogenes TaxID=66422 RepID=A0ABW7B5T3_9ACTN
MTAGHEGARDADAGAGRREEYDGMDALMAAITGDPLPEEARRDPAFLAEHRAAEADVAVLRDQLSRLADALAGEETGVEETREQETGEEGTGKEESGQGEGGKESGVSDVVVPGPRPARRPRGRTRPAGRDRPPRPPRPGRPSGPRRAMRITLGSFAGAAAFSLALGFGWLVTQAGGGADDNGGASSAAKGVEHEDAGTGLRPSDPERELACSRLVVEGTVARVEPAEDASGSRVTLTVTRSYKPGHGPAEVAFLLDADARPAPRRGQHVLVQVAYGDMYASRWTVGDFRVAAERDWITDALPGSRTTPCPSGDAS